MFCSVGFQLLVRCKVLLCTSVLVVNCWTGVMFCSVIVEVVVVVVVMIIMMMMMIMIMITIIAVQGAIRYF